MEFTNVFLFVRKEYNSIKFFINTLFPIYRFYKKIFVNDGIFV